MSAKNMDKHNRWRNVTVAFRVSPEEDELIERLVHVSGLSKQDYIIQRLQCKDVEVRGTPRVYKALQEQFVQVLEELKRIDAGDAVRPELMELISFMSVIIDGLKGGSARD